MNKDKFSRKEKVQLSAISKKLDEQIYFNTRKRNNIKKNVLRLQKSLLQSVDTTIKPVLKQEYIDREFHVSWLNICVKFLKVIKDAEIFKYDTTLKNCHFKIYKAKKGNTVIIQSKFFKICESKNKVTFVVFPAFLTNSKKKCILYRNSYKFNTSDFVLIDKGRFKQKMEDFKSFTVNYKGKIFNKKLLFTKIKDSATYYWIRIIQELK